MKLTTGVAICLCLLVKGTFLAPAFAEQVAISIVHRNGGAGDYFVAMRGSKTLWRYNSWGPILYDKKSGSSVLESSQLLVVNRFGTIKERLNFNAAHSPRSVFLDHGFLIYDTGDIALAGYDPKTEGTHLAAWLRKVRHVCVFNVQTHHLWEAPESDLGLPIACHHGYLNALRIINLNKCFQSHQMTPVVAIAEYNIKTKRRTRNAILSITRLEALNLMGAFLGIECVTPADIRWIRTGVHADGLFGKSYTGRFN